MEDDEEFEEWEEDENENNIEGILKSHIIYYAGAEVILDNKIATLLQNCGIDTAPILQHPLKAFRSDFFLVENNDNDQIDANYCDIVRANKANTLFFEKVKTLYK